MAVRIRLKRLGRKHRPYYRICVMDSREPRDGKALEEVGTYDPMIHDTDLRVTMKGERVDYWIGVGALPTEKVKILIDKYKGKVPEKRIEQRKIPAIVERMSAEAARAASGHVHRTEEERAEAVPHAEPATAPAEPSAEAPSEPTTQG